MVIIISTYFIYPLVKDNFNIETKDIIDIILILLVLFTFYKGNKISSYILIWSLIMSISMLPLYLLHFFNVLEILGGVLYIIIPAFIIILGYVWIDKNSIYDDLKVFMQYQKDKRNKLIYYLENFVLIIMVILNRIL
ncbi:hypothetical protein [Anaeromicrobium sediminis]|uniref:Uncharacterized protein n=1 Tax=Anaeromicrobium sediminis TaxID=1478221 RepID=A0A267MN38_9FIRM|nr:hypothetical protein [Anaeromicrobium sediminis]PAB60338.1 hypothetical protein CCE28_05435 [Anaeromicrobium sediminis]